MVLEIALEDIAAVDVEGEEIDRRAGIDDGFLAVPGFGDDLSCESRRGDGDGAGGGEQGFHGTGFRGRQPVVARLFFQKTVASPRPHSPGSVFPERWAPRHLPSGHLIVVGLAGFEPAASSSRTILRILRRERKIAEENGSYRGKCRKFAKKRRADADVFRELEPKNGKKKSHRGHVRGHVFCRENRCDPRCLSVPGLCAVRKMAKMTSGFSGSECPWTHCPPVGKRRRSCKNHPIPLRICP